MAGICDVGGAEAAEELRRVKEKERWQRGNPSGSGGREERGWGEMAGGAGVGGAAGCERQCGGI